jgi:hypothetical protein
MQIEYQLSEGDFVHATEFSTLRRTFWKRIRLWLFRLLGLFVVAVSLAALSSAGSKQIGVFLLLCGLFLCFHSVITKMGAKRRFKKMTQLHGSFVVDIDANGIHYTAPAGESNMDWRVWGSFAEDRNSFVLVQRGSRMFMPIPKRELSQTQIAELRTLFETHLPHK